MITTSLTTLHRFINRIRVYRQVHLVYWTKQLSEEGRQRRAVPAAEQAFANARYEKALSDYRGFTKQTLDDYTSDLMRYRTSIKRTPLLQNFIAAMKNELKAEEDRICRSRQDDSDPEEPLRQQLQQMAAHAASQLKSSLSDHS